MKINKNFSGIKSITWYVNNAVEFNSVDKIKTRGKCHMMLFPEHQYYLYYLKNIPLETGLSATISTD
ncbi:hypothetical protein M8845_03835 [Gelidibacter japonicus]|uniref:hypothetical protein n=1 Tax=Gelidibacter japonicus TaxID=1962232 RepID=UPI00202061F2|nr:hypothetical protein [Gelidibacter japonicus]MCL8006552.1 hypothetical protein [Gelidibacter japonicus]